MVRATSKRRNKLWRRVGDSPCCSFGPSASRVRIPTTSSAVTVAESGGFAVLFVRPFGLTGSNPHDFQRRYYGGEWGIRTPDTTFGRITV
jgi:hypothetical protein